MNWYKLKKDFPNIYEDIRELCNNNFDLDRFKSKSIIEKYLTNNNIEYSALYFGLKKAEHKKILENGK